MNTIHLYILAGVQYGRRGSLSELHFVISFNGMAADVDWHLAGKGIHQYL